MKDIAEVNAVIEFHHRLEEVWLMLMSQNPIPMINDESILSRYEEFRETA